MSQLDTPLISILNDYSSYPHMSLDGAERRIDPIESSARTTQSQSSFAVTEWTDDMCQLFW